MLLDSVLSEKLTFTSSQRDVWGLKPTSLEPKSQLAIILTLGRKHKEKENSQSMYSVLLKATKDHKKKKEHPKKTKRNKIKQHQKKSYLRRLLITVLKL